jgi:hypothetical protein
MNIKKWAAGAVIALSVLGGGTVAAAPAQASVSAAVDAIAPSCARGEYLNSRGFCISGPVQSQRKPAGATAQCRDKTWSFSQSRRGTCSWHGGVLRWL